MLQATLRLSEQRNRLTAATQALALARWREIPPDGDWLASWQVLLPRVVTAVSLAQVTAASQARAGMVASLLEQDWDGELAALNPRAYAGWLEPDIAPWQVPLESGLLTAPVVEARLRGSLDSGGRMLLNLTHEAVAGASRMASQALITATPDLIGVFSDSPCCQRCAVLVGKRMPHDATFKRHPQCNGTVVAVPRDKPSPVEPLDPEQVTDLNRWQRAAIEDGADFNKVVNAQTGVRGGKVLGSRSPLSENGLRTSVGTGRKAGREMRPTPKAIYRTARGDRATAQRLLREFGYLA